MGICTCMVTGLLKILRKSRHLGQPCNYAHTYRHHPSPPVRAGLQSSYTRPDAVAVVMFAPPSYTRPGVNLLNIICLKLTPEETDLLDGLVGVAGLLSRSDCLRLGLTMLASRHCSLDPLTRRAVESRRGIVSRRRQVRADRPARLKPPRPPPEMRTLADVPGL